MKAEWPLPPPWLVWTQSLFKFFDPVPYLLPHKLSSPKSSGWTSLVSVFLHPWILLTIRCYHWVLAGFGLHVERKRNRCDISWLQLPKNENKFKRKKMFLSEENCLLDYLFFISLHISQFTFKWQLSQTNRCKHIDLYRYKYSYIVIRYTDGANIIKKPRCFVPWLRQIKLQNEALRKPQPSSIFVVYEAGDLKQHKLLPSFHFAHQLIAVIFPIFFCH